MALKWLKENGGVVYIELLNYYITYNIKCLNQKRHSRKS